MMVSREDMASVEMIYANTFAGLGESIGMENCYLIEDCNRDTPMSVLRCARDIFVLIRKERPDLIISTGAVQGLIAIVIGKIFGCRTIWVESVANSVELSMSGRLAGKFADLWLTQWQHISRLKGPLYWGSIL